jgi:hypothetical protein
MLPLSSRCMRPYTLCLNNAVNITLRLAPVASKSSLRISARWASCIVIVETAPFAPGVFLKCGFSRRRRSTCPIVLKPIDSYIGIPIGVATNITGPNPEPSQSSRQCSTSLWPRPLRCKAGSTMTIPIDASASPYGNMAAFETSFPQMQWPTPAIFMIPVAKQVA